MKYSLTFAAFLAAASSQSEAFTAIGIGGNVVRKQVATPLEAVPPPAAAAIGLLKKARNLARADEDNNDAPPLKRVKARKIAMMIEPTPFTHVSGYSNRFKELLRYLAKAGDNVEIVTTESEARIKSKHIELPSEIHGYPIHHTQGFIFPLYNHIALTFDLPEMVGAQVIERLKPDLIHVTSPGIMVLAALFYARVMRVPLVMSYHTHLPIYGRNYLGWIPGIEELAWKLIRMVHRRADLTLVTSPQMRQEFIENGVPRVDVWRKGVDTLRFHPNFKSDEMRTLMTDGNPKDFLMVYVGRLGAEKRLKDLKPILERMPEARLCIVGKGPQEEELKKYFKGTKTVFTGQLSGDELSQAFASGDVFMMPSDSETLGFVVLESMASGVPVIGANAGGIPSLIHDGDDSFLVETGDINGFMNVLNKLKDAKYREEIGKNARKEAERWSWEAATSVLRNIQYERALINFHSRAFGGFGSVGSQHAWRLLGWRIRRMLGKMHVPGFRNTPATPPKSVTAETSRLHKWVTALSK